jgi:hypothetical protein
MLFVKKMHYGGAESGDSDSELYTPGGNINVLATSPRGGENQIIVLMSDKPEFQDFMRDSVQAA